MDYSLRENVSNGSRMSILISIPGFLDAMKFADRLP